MGRRFSQRGCLAAATIGQIAAGEITVEPAIAEHLGGCSRCAARLDRARETTQFIDLVRNRLGPVEPVDADTEATEGTLRGYRLLEEISRGGQATVHRAVHEPTGRPAAVKIMHSRSTRERARLEREARLVARLRHPGVVTVFDCGTLDDGSFAIAMEYIDGAPLDEWSARVDAEARSPREALRRKLDVMVRICDAVDHAHRRAVIHRDLKPGNILVGDDDAPHVLDFGVAREDSAMAATITRTGEFAGTLVFAAPEQLGRSDEPIDVRSDVYTLGVIGFTLAVGTMPYRSGLPASELMRAIVDEPVVVPATGAGGFAIERDLATIISKALAKEPERRYRSAASLGDDLRHFLTGDAIDARRDSAVYVLRKFAARHRPAVVTAFVVAGLLVASSIALSISARIARTERNRAEAEAARFATQLRETTLRQGVALATSGGVTASESIIWREVLDPSTGDATDTESSGPDFVAGLWALRAQYAASPCLASTLLDKWPVAAVFERDSKSILIVKSSGRLVRLGVPGLRELDHLESSLETLDGDDIPLAVIGTDSRRIYLARDGRTRIDVVDLEDGAVIGVVESPGKRIVVAMAVTPSGRAVFTCGEGGLGIVSEDASLERFHAASPGNRGSSLATDGVRALYAADDGAVVAVDLETGTVEKRLDRAGAVPGAICPVAIAPGGRLLFNDGHLLVHRLFDGFEQRFGSGRDALHAVAVAPDGSLAVTARRQGAVAVHRIDDDGVPSPPMILAGHPPFRDSTLAPPAFSPDGTMLVTTTDDGSVRLWSTDVASSVTRVHVHESTVHAVEPAPDGGVWSVGTDAALAWSRHDAAPVVRDLPTTDQVIYAAVSPDGRWLATDERGESARIVVRDTITLETVMPPIVCAPFGGPFDFSPDSTWLAAAAGNARLAIIDPHSGTSREVLDAVVPSLGRAVRFSPDGQTVAWATIDGRVTLLEPGDAEARTVLDSGLAVRSLAFSPDGNELVTGHEDGRLMRWDLASRTQIGEQAGHAHWPMSIAYSPDGTVIASADYAGEIHIWCARRFRPLGVLRDDGTPIHTLAFVNADRIVTGDDLGRILTWDLARDDHAIARNLEFWIAHYAREGQPTPFAPAMRAWAQNVETERPPHSATTTSTTSATPATRR